jgi:hypothetical protein
MHYGMYYTRITCHGCGYTFRGLPSHAYCEGCADIRERGGEMPEYYHNRGAWKVAPAPAPAPLPLTDAERRKVTAWKAERAVHNVEAAKLRRARAAWNLSVTAPAPVAKVVRRRPKAD